MEREKRQRKPSKPYEIPKACYPRVHKKKAKKKMPVRAEYQVIPAPMKLSCIATFFPIYAVNRIS